MLHRKASGHDNKFYHAETSRTGVSSSSFGDVSYCTCTGGMCDLRCEHGICYVSRALLDAERPKVLYLHLILFFYPYRIVSCVQDIIELFCSLKHTPLACLYDYWCVINVNYI